MSNQNDDVIVKEEKNMTKKNIKVVVLILFLIFFHILFTTGNDKDKKTIMEDEIILPSPVKEGGISVEEALFRRRSIRSYSDKGLTTEEISQILWSAQGITDISGKRTAPSAGALYPLEVYIFIRKGEGIKSGLYNYNPEGHKLSIVSNEDISENLAKAALNQSFIKEASAALIVSAFFKKTTDRYGERGIQYVYIEAGHLSQNVYLQAESLNLLTVAVGAFNEEDIKEIVKMEEKETPIYIMPIGKR